MSKVCAICGKKPSFGNNRSHSMVATKRRFNPNLQRVRVLLEGKATRAYVCTRCLKAGKVQEGRSDARARRLTKPHRGRARNPAASRRGVDASRDARRRAETAASATSRPSATASSAARRSGDCSARGLRRIDVGGDDGSRRPPRRRRVRAQPGESRRRPTASRTRSSGRPGSVAASRCTSTTSGSA